ncbi:hypothetical protein [Bacillus subtilis]|uniref:hypothetical protein n=1 Tax=Bacillus subtilis TaxID=1423 RepID=UPI0016424649|nr:hypothetical protein [Bacillus subtilis]
MCEGKGGKDVVVRIEIDLEKEVEKMIEKKVKCGKGRGSRELLEGGFVVMMEARKGEVV